MEILTLHWDIISYAEASWKIMQDHGSHNLHSLYPSQIDKTTIDRCCWCNIQSFISCFSVTYSICRNKSRFHSLLLGVADAIFSTLLFTSFFSREFFFILLFEYLPPCWFQWPQFIILSAIPRQLYIGCDWYFCLSLAGRSLEGEKERSNIINHSA